MGRVKLEIKRIENSSTRQVTYSKRRNGLLKKAYELSVLCDIDLALIMFSPSGRLSHFSGKNSRIEDVITKFVKLPEHERAKGLKSRRIDNNVSTTRALQMEEGLIQAVQKLNIESGLNNHSGSSNGEIERIQLEIQKTVSQLQLAEEMLRAYELDIRQIDSMSQAEQMEQLLEQALKGVQLRKQAMQSNQFASFNQAQMQAIYMWQSSQNGGESSRHVPQDLPWYASRDSQILENSAAASILSFRNNSQAQVECPPSTSYHPGLLPPGPHDYSTVKTGNSIGDNTSVDFSDNNALCSASIWHSSCPALALAPLTSHTPSSQYSLGQQHCLLDNTHGRSENRDAEIRRGSGV